MTAGGAFRFRFTTHGSPRFDNSWQRLSETDFRDRRGRMEQLWRQFGPPPEWAQDLLQVSRAVYLVDRLAPRSRSADRWTRDIELSVQLVEPHRWTEHARNDLQALLRMLTADRWWITFHDGALPYQDTLPFQDTLLDAERGSEVALFSGGVDSTSYAAQRATHAGGKLLLVAYDWTLKTPQVRICQDIVAIGKSRKIELRQISQNPIPRQGRLDLTNRSRGFLFIATAVAVAAAHRLKVVAVPENGQLAVNPPLTTSRSAACSTRTVHPWVIDRINRVIAGIDGDVRVNNPLLDRTKGEACTLALQAGLARGTLDNTVSCSHPRTPRRKSSSYHCGYCYACLVRRAGMLKALGGDDTDYLTSLVDLGENDKKAKDIRALCRWLEQPFTVYDVIADAPFPKDVLPDSVMPVLQRGRQELGAMLDRLAPQLRKATTRRLDSHDQQ